MKLIWILMLCSFSVWGQNQLTGKIFGQNEQQKIPLESAEVYWLHTQIYTLTDANGNFSIAYEKKYKKLIINYIGYKQDTLNIDSNQYFEHVLQPDLVLQEVNIASTKKNLQVSQKGVHLTEQINKGELLKAACCNLSESFETNPSIDVSFTDALSGIKQIQMLGLSSPYLQYTQENIPAIRGANQLQGFSQIPGTWIESIQISKGAGSVINGYESISGQVNFELKKPELAEKLFLNLYAAQNGRMEFNTNFNQKISDKLATGIYIHGNILQQKTDHNNDGFLDTPLGNQVNLLNRWSYNDVAHGVHSSLIVRYLSDNRQSGQLDYEPQYHQGTTQFWGAENQQQRWDVFTKLGFMFPDLPYKSIGFQFNYAYHEQESYFGLKNYNITHNTMYLNAIYQSIISNTYHQFKTGISINHDKYDEVLNQTPYFSNEKGVGTFFEYNYQQSDKFTLNAGLRADYHNQIKFFNTYRLHLRWQPFNNSTIRASVGNGRRNANIFIENPQWFVTNRSLLIQQNSAYHYGLLPEKAINMGINWLQRFKMNQQEMTITAEYYYTKFMNQVIADWENTRQLNFYNLHGKSYAQSLQVFLQYHPFKDFEMRLAYKNTQQKTQYNSGLLLKPLQPLERWFLNLSYQVKNQNQQNPWMFDFTMNRIGKMRIPDTTLNPVSSQLPAYSPVYFLANAQISKFWHKKWSIYLGVENMTNYTQHHPILGHTSPFGTYFDGSLTYAPVDGRMIYGGFRYELK